MLRILISILLSCSISLATQGQKTACFEVFNRETGEMIADSGDTIVYGCAPLKIRVQDCTPSGTSVDWSYEEGQLSPNPDSVNWTYEDPGTYRIRQRVSYEDVNTDTTKTVIVHPTPKPTFDVFLCQGRSARIDITGDTYDEYAVDYDDGTRDTLAPEGDTVHTFPATSDYNVTVTGLYQPENCGNSKTQTASIIDHLPQPTIKQAEVLTYSGSSGQIKLTFEADSNLNYRILQTTHPSGNTGTVKTLTGQNDTIQAIVENLDTKNNTYCYQVEAFDQCGNDTLSSSVCSINLTTTAKDRYNQLQWNSYPEAQLQKYIVYRNGSVLDSTNATELRDSSITCGLEYCYYIEGRVQAANTQGNPVIPSISNDSCVTGKSDERPDTIDALISSGHNGNVLLRWEAPDHPVKHYILERKTTGDFQQIATIARGKTRYTDRNISINRKPCYRLSYRDSCDKQAAWSPTGCPVSLRLTELNSVTLKLDWSGFKGYADSVSHYLLKKITPDGNVYESIDVGKNMTYTDELPDTIGQKIRYQVEAIPVNSAFATGKSNQVSYEQNVKVFFPDAFTPNGDGLNDRFFPKGRFIKNITLYIYNRWGELIHVARNKKQGWDGRLNNGKAPAGVYTYKAEITDETGVTFSQKGSFLLIRK